MTLVQNHSLDILSAYMTYLGENRGSREEVERIYQKGLRDGIPPKSFFTSALNSFCNIFAFKQAIQVFRHMKHAGHPLESGCYNPLLESLARRPSEFALLHSFSLFYDAIDSEVKGTMKVMMNVKSE